MSTLQITLNGQIVNVVSVPTSPERVSVQFDVTDAVALVTSEFTGQTQAQQWPGADMLSGTMTLPPLTQKQADDWICFLMQCRGMANAFLLGDPLQTAPRGSGAGSPTTAGINVAGAQILNTNGWPASSSGVLRRGDWLQAGYRLYRSLDDVNTDSSGYGVIPVWPSVRETPSGIGAPYVQAINGNTATSPLEGGGSPTGSFTLPNPTKAGDTLLVCVECYSLTSTFTAPTVSDGANSYTLIGHTTPFQRNVGGGDGSWQSSYAFIATGIGGGAVTVSGSVTVNGYGFKIVVAEYGPCTGVDAFATTTAPAGGGTVVPAASVTTTAADESLVFLTSFGVTPVSSGYSTRLAGGNNNGSQALFDAPAVAAGAYTFTPTVASDNYVSAFLLALKMSPVPGAGSSAPLVLNNPVGLFRLASNKRTWSADVSRATRLSFAVQEYR